MATKIDTVTARDKLKPRREPYWHRISKGCYLGFRKMSAGGQGSWTARVLDAHSGKQTYQALGDFGDLPEHLRFDAAQKAAKAWFEHLERGGQQVRATVGEACERYVRHLRAVKTDRAADDANRRFVNYVLNDAKLAMLELSKLTPSHLQGWRTALREQPTRSGPNRGERRLDATLNRDMTCLRAALNLAYDDGLVTSDFAWRSKLAPIKNAERRRELYLDRAQRRAFVEAAETDLANFLKALSLLPLRPGALAALCIGQYDARLKVLKIGKDKHGQDRKIKMPDVTGDFLAQMSKGRAAHAPLLARAGGLAWNKDSWKWPVKQAALMAKLPLGTTAYTLRHSVISDLVHEGLDLLTVAQMSGTSVAMIERHYGHLVGDRATKALAALAL